MDEKPNPKYIAPGVIPAKDAILDFIAKMEKDGKFEPVTDENQWKWNKGGTYNVIWANFRERESQVIEACYK